ncbi:Germin-like protein 2-4 [Capsicum baccatum]|uniref:Germin-like protein 2-4 n=1 Tax=Capsicum baccatum TaxID=33114 RepID=A0A2G2VP69_CAPBA|nr:Germin-like protein 2-4 [Capsicum baccatum]
MENSDSQEDEMTYASNLTFLKLIELSSIHLYLDSNLRETLSEIQWLGVFIQDRNKCSIPQQCLLPVIVEGIKDPGNFKHTRFLSFLVSSTVFPGPNTLGMPFVRADFDVDGVNVPYFYPRATKMALVLEGKIYLGFVDSGNRFFAKVDVDNDNDVIVDNAPVQEVVDESNVLLRRSTRQHISSSHYSPNEYVLLTDGEEHEYYKEAMKDENKDQ